MAIWQMAVLFGLAGCAIVCLLGTCIVIAKLAKGIFSIAAELTKMNEKIERIETVNRDEPKAPIDQFRLDPSLEDIEAAISNIEKLKRIDLTKS